MQNGKDTVLLVQLATNALGEDGYLIGHLTENSHSMENELVDEQTKFGRIVAYGQSSESFEVTMFGDKTDPGQKAILDAIRNKVQLKVWEVDLNTVKNDAGEDVHDSIFAYTLVESVEKSNPGDNFQEVSGTLQVIGESKTGQLPKLPNSVIEFATYGFEAPGEKTGEFGKGQDDAVAVTSVTVTPATTSIAVNATKQLSVVVAPDNASNQNVTFTSSDTSVAKVSPTGLVTGLTAGTSTVTVTTVSGAKTATVAVTVTA
ncbi:phage major tail protein, TP901-1 family [Lysinibacillus sp. FSL M8-0337]